MIKLIILSQVLLLYTFCAFKSSNCIFLELTCGLYDLILVRWRGVFWWAVFLSSLSPISECLYPFQANTDICKILK